ncbi:ribonuclease E activity regulator RraA [Desulfospira joergensenii]|uniref:ribonuclease E activity regulator RraA n=1 Tax=Desulfospira joergensenii TaxID=53329 RepID=UPI0003B51DE0|nr:ribonuclease E activity regulator RraA [Desulfospira joergensenii]
MKTADLMDDFQDQLQSCEIQFRNFGGRRAFWGPCRTVQCHGDNVLLRKTIEEPAQGHVLVVDGNGSLFCALMGDMIAALGMKNNWSGVVINGAVRDTRDLGKMDFGIKALGSNPRKSQKKGRGKIDVPVNFGKITIAPGNWIYCDEDGVVVAEKELPVNLAL